MVTRVRADMNLHPRADQPMPRRIQHHGASRAAGDQPQLRDRSLCHRLGDGMTGQVDAEPRCEGAPREAGAAGLVGTAQECWRRVAAQDLDDAGLDDGDLDTRCR